MKMKNRVVNLVSAALIVSFISFVAVSPAHAATIGPSLQKKLVTLSDNDSAGIVIVAFDTADGLHQSHIDFLSSVLGSNALGLRLVNLGMVGTAATKAQINQIAASSMVRSIWANDPLHLDLHQARVLTGVDKLRVDPILRPANGGGRPFDGHAVAPNSVNPGPLPPAGTVNYNSPLPVVVINDSGIDGRHPDLYYTLPPLNSYASKVIQNVLISSDPLTPYQVPLPIPPGQVTPLSYEENIQDTDLNVAHGTHCSGIVGGTGHFALATSDTLADPANAPLLDFSGLGSAGRFSSAIYSGHGHGDYAPDANPATTNPNIPAGGNPAPIPQNMMGEASGVKLIGTGSGAGLLVLNALGGFEYCLIKQQTYNIRIVSNSWGSQGAYSPDDPVNVASKQLHDAGIAVVFAAGNSGPTVNTIGPQSKSPYVICVAAGTKEGGLASFSSRGLPARQRHGDAVANSGTHYNPDAFNLPAITAPGTGWGFGFDGNEIPVYNEVNDPNGKHFTSDIVSTKTLGVANGQFDAIDIPPAYQDYYTEISGTSMACPFIAGTCALLLDANPNLTPDQLKTILQTTATHMPDMEDWQVGAGYVNVYAAVDRAVNVTKAYHPFNRIDAPYGQFNPPWNTTIARTELDPPQSRPIQPGNTAPYPPASITADLNHGEDFAMPYTPALGAGSYSDAEMEARNFPNQNAYAFTVGPDPVTGKPVTVLDVRIQFGGNAATIIAGNSLVINVWAPDGTNYNAFLPPIPLEQAPAGQLIIKNPIPGTWVVEATGFLGTPSAAPDNVIGQVFRSNIVVTEPPDIAQVPQKSAIENALANRYLDTNPDGTFQPTTSVTRSTFAQALADNTPLRQTIGSNSSSKSFGKSGTLDRAAEALSVPGSTLRDWDFTPAATLTGGLGLAPQAPVRRVQAAISLVRALGLDKEALAISAKPVQVNYNGTLTNVVDANDGSIAASAKGYVQLALNRGILTYAVEQSPEGATQIRVYPNSSLIRGDLAVALNAFRQIFSQGNSLSAAELP
jgi:serine protease AprX